MSRSPSRTNQGVVRPGPLFAVAAASLVVVIVATLEMRSSTCAPAPPTPLWVDVVFWGFALTSVLSAFSGVLAFGVRQGWHPVASFLAAFCVTTLCYGLSFVIMVGILIGPCLG